jgi:hypothetical protein
VRTMFMSSGLMRRFCSAQMVYDRLQVMDVCVRSVQLHGRFQTPTWQPRQHRRGFITHAPIGSLFGSPISLFSLHFQSHRQGAYNTQIVERKYPHFPGLHFPAKITLPFLLQRQFQVDLTWMWLFQRSFSPQWRQDPQPLAAFDS